MTKGETAMRRNLLISILAGVLVLFATGLSYAGLVEFSDLQTYPIGGSGGMAIGGVPSIGQTSYSKVVSHEVTFSPLLKSFAYADLDVTYYGIDENKNSERWIALGSNTNGTPYTFIQLGELAGHGSTEMTQTFHLSSLSPKAPDGGLSSWTLYLIFGEDTPYVDSFSLLSTRVHGEYTHAPVPPTIVLLGSFLVAYGGLRYSHKSKRS